MEIRCADVHDGSSGLFGDYCHRSLTDSEYLLADTCCPIAFD